MARHIWFKTEKKKNKFSLRWGGLDFDALQKHVFSAARRNGIWFLKKTRFLCGEAGLEFGSLKKHVFPAARKLKPFPKKNTFSLNRGNLKFGREWASLMKITMLGLSLSSWKLAALAAKNAWTKHHAYDIIAKKMKDRKMDCLWIPGRLMNSDKWWYRTVAILG